MFISLTEKASKNSLPGPPPRVSDLVGLGWAHEFANLKNSPVPGNHALRIPGVIDKMSFEIRLPGFESQISHLIVG